MLAVVLGLWYGASYLLLSPTRRFLLPPPQSVVSVGLLTWSNLDQILTSLAFTAKTAVLGFFLATVIGISLAIIMSQAKWVERAVYPYAVILQTIPILAIVPLIGFAFGFNFGSRVLVCVLIALFPDNYEHTVRPVVGRRGSPRPVHTSRREPGATVVEAPTASRSPEYLYRATHIGRALGNRSGRGRFLFPARSARAG